MMECRLTIVNSLGQPVTTLDSEVVGAERRPRRRTRAADRMPDRHPAAAARPLPDRRRCVKGKRQIQDGLQAAAFFDVEPGVIGDRPMPAAGADGDVALAHAWRLPS